MTPCFSHYFGFSPLTLIRHHQVSESSSEISLFRCCAISSLVISSEFSVGVAFICKALFIQNGFQRVNLILYYICVIVFQNPHAGPERRDKQCSLWKLPKQKTCCGHLQQWGQQSEQGTAHQVSLFSVQYDHNYAVDVPEIGFTCVNSLAYLDDSVKTFRAAPSLFTCREMAGQRSMSAVTEPRIKVAKLSTRHPKPALTPPTLTSHCHQLCIIWLY